MNCGPSSTNPPISNGAVRSAWYQWEYDEVGCRWVPRVIATSEPTFGLRLAGVPIHQYPLLVTPSPISYQPDDVQDHITTSAYCTNTDVDVLPSTYLPSTSLAHLQEGNTQATEASGSFQGTPPCFPASTPSEGNVYEKLCQSVYCRGLTSEAFRLPDMMFQEIGLGDALQNDFHRLADQDRGAWPANSTFEVPQKLAIVFCFPGYSKYSRQVNVLRHVRGRRLPQTRSKLAHIIAEEMQTFLTLSRQNGKPLDHRGRPLDLADLVLIDVQHISRGSLQPTIGVVVRPPHSTITT